MSQSGGPTPEFDPYFVAREKRPKGGEKWSPSGDEDIRRDLLPTEVAFHVAGTVGMVLAASVFVTFGVPVSGMLREAGEPGGILFGEDWRWRRWVARMASVLPLAVVGAVTSWGLRRRRPWARWALMVLGAVPPLAMIAGLGLRAWGVAPAVRELLDVMTLPCVGVVVLSASIAAYWAACSRRGRAVFRPHYEDVVARTRESSPNSTIGVLAGVGLTWAKFVLYWTLLFLFLSVLAACGVIRSV